MKQADYVSIWLGEIDSAESLEEFLEQEYTDDGDALPSAFMRAFGIKRYNDDLREAHHVGQSTWRLKELLSGFSGAEAILGYLMEFSNGIMPGPFNAAILLYDYQYDRRVLHAEDGENRWMFLRTFNYKNPPREDNEIPTVLAAQIVPELKRLVRDMVEGRFEEIGRDDRGGRYPAFAIAEALADYPGTPTMPPDSAFVESGFQGPSRVGFHICWHPNSSPPEATVEFFLWYDGEPSDLMVKCICTFPGGRMNQISIWDIYVP